MHTRKYLAQILDWQKYKILGMKEATLFLIKV